MDRRLIVSVSSFVGVVLVAASAALAVPGPSPTDSGTSAQLDRIDANAYAACQNAAGSNTTRLARCTAPPTMAPTTAPPTATPPTSSAPATTTPPSTPPSGGCAWPACFPTAATTGVPAGTALTTVNGDLHAAGGTTIDGKDIQGSLIVDGPSVTVRNTRIHGLVFDSQQNGHVGLTLTDSEITADPGQSYSVGNFPPITGSYELTRVHVHRWQDGPRTDRGIVTIRDSLVDELAFAAGEHPDAVQQYCPGCVVHVTIDHSTLSGCAGNSIDKGNSAIFWSDHPGTGSTLSLTHSRLACGQFTIRINDTGSGVAGNFPGVVAEVRDNTVAAGSYAGGPAECGNGRAWNGTDGVKWSGNVLDTGPTIPSPCS